MSAALLLLQSIISLLTISSYELGAANLSLVKGGEAFLVPEVGGCGAVAGSRKKASRSQQRKNCSAGAGSHMCSRAGSIAAWFRVEEVGWLHAVLNHVRHLHVLIRQG